MRSLLLTTLAALALPLLAHGKAKGGPAGGPAKPKGTADLGLPAARPFDLNYNGRIDGEEIQTLRQFFHAHPESPLKQYDTNKDGQLDDVEIDAIRFPTEKTTVKPKKKGGLLKG